MNIYCLQGFNNYYNRVVRKFDTLNDYFDHQNSEGKAIVPFQGINFVPNDCVNTEQILNWSQSWLPDYFITYDPDSGKMMRWFVMESIRQRGSQYQFRLRRDLIVDFYDSILDAPCFIEKANINDDYIILNSENMTFNQIKTKEFQLKDATNCPWIVGYYDSTYTDKEHPNYKMYIDEQEPTDFDIAEASTFENWDYYKYINEDFIGDPANLQYIISATNLINYEGTIRYTITNTSSSATLGSDGDSAVGFRGSPPSHDRVKQAMLDYYPHPKGLKTFEAQTYNGGYIRFHLSNSSASKKFKNLNGKIIRFSSDIEGEYVYKKIIIKPKQETYKTHVQSGSLFDSLKGVMESLNATAIPTNNLSAFYVSLTTESYRIEYEDIIPGRLIAKIDKTAYNLTDAPYGMFAIPYPILRSQEEEEDEPEPVIIKNTGTNTTVTVNAEAGMRVAMAFAKKYAKGGVLYDVQLLPYCPVQKIIQEDGSLDLLNDTLRYSYITIDDEDVSVILNASVSSFTLNIPFEELPITNSKIQSQTDMCRLVSPNFNGQFEFNIVKNGGLNNFNIDCTYLPFSPYIHINPNFGRLYGKDFNDARGLVCGGDFSLPIVNDAWEAYKIQNKNYLNIFDRQIQNMEIQNKFQGIGDAIKALTGSATGAASGALAGSIIAPGIGAGIGAAVGGIASMAGGVADVAINEALRKEAIDFTRDNFGYQLGNIQALPNSISKTTAYTFNNKIYPILEYYTCSEIEKRALAYKIANNGMTIMMIGKIKDYKDNTWSYDDIISRNYIKGQLIKIEDINCDDFHVANEIANEVNKGVYL